MNYVEPIRDPDKIEAMKAVLRKQSLRNYFLFVAGINIGIRIGDLLKLTVKDMSGSHIIINEQKTGKEKRFKINASLQQEVAEYIQGMAADDYLFPSRQGGRNVPLSRISAWRIINEAAAVVGIPHIGTHTLRKTFGYHFYQKTKDIALLQHIFNHSSPSVTLRYIGINQDILDNAVDDFSL
ncbi:MAG TPA: site-specific integrase [bacterium]|nr:site-specific integrase [bacterium]